MTDKVERQPAIAKMVAEQRAHGATDADIAALIKAMGESMSAKCHNRT
jgi:hypothetical protein